MGISEEIVKFVKNIDFDWEYYVKLNKRAQGEGNKEAHNILRILNQELITHKAITVHEGYMIEKDGKPYDYIQAFPGVSTKIVNKTDAWGLASALGYRARDIIKVK